MWDSFNNSEHSNTRPVVRDKWIQLSNNLIFKLLSPTVKLKWWKNVNIYA